MRKSSKKVLEAAFKLVEDWSAGYRMSENVDLNQFMEAVKQYDQTKFFDHYGLGINRALAQLKKEKSL